MKRSNCKLLYFILLFSVFYTVIGNDLDDTIDEIPATLYYNNQPIADEFIYKLYMSTVGTELNIRDYYLLATQEQNKRPHSDLEFYDISIIEENTLDRLDSFYWEYAGSVANNIHVVITHQGSWHGEDTSAMIIKRTDNTIRKTAEIYFYGTCIVKDNCITYAYQATDYEFMNKAIELYPEITYLYKNNLKKKLNRSNLCGYFTNKATIDSEGTIINNSIDSFEVTTHRWGQNS